MSIACYHIVIVLLVTATVALADDCSSCHDGCYPTFCSEDCWDCDNREYYQGQPVDRQSANNAAVIGCAAFGVFCFTATCLLCWCGRQRVCNPKTTTAHAIELPPPHIEIAQKV
jgi:hypothetical protein